MPAMKLYRKLWLKYLDIKEFFLKMHLKMMYGKAIEVGEGVRIEGNFHCYINPHDAKISIESDVILRENCFLRAENGAILTIGQGVFINNSCSITSMKKIMIGSNTIIGEGVKMYDHNHQYKGKGNIKDQGYELGEISIGSNVWIGSNSLILKGVTIGDNAIIGAGNIVYKPVAPGTIIKNKAEHIVNERS